MIAEEFVIDIFGDTFLRDPYDSIRRAREMGRIARDPFGSMILLRIEDFEAVAADDRFGAFGDRLARMLGLDPGPAFDWLAGSLMFLDPPDHTRIRGLVRKEFTPRRVAELRPAILETTDRLLDAQLRRGAWLSGPLRETRRWRRMAVITTARTAYLPSARGFGRPGRPAATGAGAPV